MSTATSLASWPCLHNAFISGIIESAAFATDVVPSCPKWRHINPEDEYAELGG